MGGTRVIHEARQTETSPAVLPELRGERFRVVAFRDEGQFDEGCWSIVRILVCHFDRPDDAWPRNVGVGGGHGPLQSADRVHGEQRTVMRGAFSLLIWC